MRHRVAYPVDHSVKYINGKYKIVTHEKCELLYKKFSGPMFVWNSKNNGGIGQMLSQT